jgi:hypothetical protein
MSQATAPGYRRKPIWIHVVALLFLLAPVGNFVFGLIALGYRRWPSPEDFSTLLASVPTTAWALQACVAATGVALLFVRRGSLLLATVTLLALNLYNLFNFREFSVIGGANLAVLIVITAAVLAAFYLTDFRKPYLNPRVRWWETAARYRADLSVGVLEGETDFRLLDVSRTGALVAGPGHLADRLRLGAAVSLRLPDGARLSAEIVREAHDVEGEGRAWGLQFKGLGKAAKQALREFLSTLDSDPSKLTR